MVIMAMGNIGMARPKGRGIGLGPKTDPAPPIQFFAAQNQKGKESSQ